MVLLSDDIVGAFPVWANAQPQYADLNLDNIVAEFSGPPRHHAPRSSRDGRPQLRGRCLHMVSSRVLLGADLPQWVSDPEVLRIVLSFAIIVPRGSISVARTRPAGPTLAAIQRATEPSPAPISRQFHPGAMPHFSMYRNVASLCCAASAVMRARASRSAALSKRYFVVIGLSSGCLSVETECGTDHKKYDPRKCAEVKPEHPAHQTITLARPHQCPQMSLSVAALAEVHRLRRVVIHSFYGLSLGTAHLLVRPTPTRTRLLSADRPGIAGRRWPFHP